MSDNTRSISRRRILQSAVSASGVAGLTGVVTGEDDEKPDVAKVGKAHSVKVIQNAFRDKETRKLMRLFVKKGYNPRISDSVILHTTHKGAHWDTMTIPFEDSATNEKTYIAWSNNPNYDRQVSGVHTEHFDPPDKEGWWDVTTYWYEGDTLQTKTKRTPNFLGCSDIDWGCVLTLAGAYGGTIAACGACASTAGWLVWACAACISTIAASGGATLTCPWCND